MRYLSANYVFSISSPPLKNGIVCVNDNGCIVDVIDTGGKLEERAKLEFYNGILVPGFVNAHCHLELSHLRGVMEPNIGLPKFVTSIGKLRQATDETILTAAKVADSEMWRNGIVAVGDISNNACTFPVKRDSPMRYRTFVEVFGLDNSRADEIFTAAKQVEQEYHRAGMPATVVPHANYSVSQALWELLYQSYTSSPPQVISIHHQESNEDLRLTIDDLRFHRSKIFNQKSKIVNRKSKILLVHNTFSSRDDLSEYVAAPEKFFFALCPGSNLFLQNHLPDFHLFASPDLCTNTCLGTDSLASNTNLSILEEMKIIQQHAPEISLEMLVQWATLNGAKALKFDHLLGSTEKGKTPGINLISQIDFKNMRLTAGSTVKPLVQIQNLKKFNAL